MKMYTASIEGYPGVGKTSWLNKLCGSSSCIIEITCGKKNMCVRLEENIPDTNLFLLLFDLSDRSTLSIMSDKKYRYKQNLLIGTKSDLFEECDGRLFLSTSSVGDMNLDKIMSRIFKKLEGGSLREVSWKIL